MSTSSSSNSPNSGATSSPYRRTPFSKQINCAIRDKSCPICLSNIHYPKAAVLPACMHVYCVPCIHKWSQLKRNCPLCNSHFHSWLSISTVSNQIYRQHQLPNLVHDKKNKLNQTHHHTSQRSRFPPHSVNQQSRQLPWRRPFGWSRCVSHDDKQKHEIILQWRASIYEQRLQAVPLPSNNQNISMNRIVKESMQRRIEPWITRELQAILQDPDPTVIVHLATSLYMSSLEAKPKASSAIEDTFVQQLRSFLQDHADIFWHELRCFAQSSFEMSTYDAVVEYKHME